jgi:hypothetical protein
MLEASTPSRARLRLTSALNLGACDADFETFINFFQPPHHYHPGKRHLHTPIRTHEPWQYSSLSLCFETSESRSLDSILKAVLALPVNRVTQHHVGSACVQCNFQYNHLYKTNHLLSSYSLTKYTLDSTKISANPNHRRQQCADATLKLSLGIDTTYPYIMDFSSDSFQPPRNISTFSDDTMDHAELVMACRFGWTRSTGPNNPGQQTPVATHTPLTAPLTTSSNNTRTKRFVPCRGRLYHQLACSHRIRTDLVEDCGANCLDPLTIASNVPFYCHECYEQEANNIWIQREAQHNSAYPPMDRMTKEQYDRWYDEHRQLEALYSKDRKIYQLELKSSTRPSNFCSAIEASQEEKDFAAELDSLSLRLCPSNNSIIELPPARVTRISLPNDASEQLHWGLNALALDRGSCGIEYSASQPSSNGGVAMTGRSEQDDLWRKPRERN